MLKNSQGDNFTHGKRRGMNKSIRKGMPDGRGVAIRRTIEKMIAKKAPVGKKKQGKAGTAWGTTRGELTATGAQSNQEAKSKTPFSETDMILLVGEGNFSFAASLATLLGNAELISATCLDSKEEVERKYPDAVQHIASITDLGGSVYYEVDGTKLEGTKSLSHLRGLVTKLVFNFPHAGAGIKDQDHNILSNQRLLAGFFHNAKGMLSQGSEEETFTPRGPVTLPQGQILVTLKSGLPYDEWGIVEIASNAGLGVKSCTPFKVELYPGYEHRRTIGASAAAKNNVEIVEKQPKTYAFFDKKAAMAAANHRKTLIKRSKNAARKDKASLMRKRKDERGQGGEVRGRSSREKEEESDDEDD